MAIAIDKLTELGGHRYSALPDEQKRALAVAAALEVIVSSVSHSADANHLSYAMTNLSAYADEIQKALGAKK